MNETLLPPTPDTDGAPSMEPTASGPEKKNTVKIVAIIATAVVLLGAVAFVTTTRDRKTTITNPDGSTATVADSQWVSGATAMEAVNYIWADKGTTLCQSWTDGITYQGYDYDQLDAMFVTGYNNPSGGYGARFPDVDGSIVFSILFQKCADLGY